MEFLPVVLIVHNLDAIFDPHYGGGWVGFDMAFQYGVILKSLALAGSVDGDNGGEFHLHSYVPLHTPAYAILSHTVVGTSEKGII
jgi:hypothetical protein